MGFRYGQIVERLAVTATAGSTTTLTNVSLQNQVFTGTSAQTVIFPDATTMSVGQSFTVYNQSTAALILQFNGGSAFTDAAGTSYGSLVAETPILVILQTNGTAAGTWAVFPIPASSSNPTGTILGYGGSSAPSGYVLCDGSAISRTTFANLFAVISTTYGVGDGSTTFNVPNSQGVFLRGAGTQTISAVSYTGTRGTTQAQGTKLPTIAFVTGNENSSHTHDNTTAEFVGNSNIPSGSQTNRIWSTNQVGSTSRTNTSSTESANHTHNVASGGDAETQPANISVNYIIKT